MEPPKTFLTMVACRFYFSLDVPYAMVYTISNSILIMNQAQSIHKQTYKQTAVSSHVLLSRTYLTQWRYFSQEISNLIAKIMLY